MMTDLAWRWNRLRVMSTREIIYRGVRWAGTMVERWRVTHGWVPEPVTDVKPMRSLFPAVDGWEAAWKAGYSLDQSGLGNLLSGRLDLFGRSCVNVGMPVDWSLDPVTGIRAPRTFGKTIDYRNASRCGDIKILWELGRQQHLVPLAIAYLFTGDERYKRSVVAQIDDWISTNPYGMGIHWCSSLELALRLISWAVIHSILALRDGERGLFGAVSDSRALGKAIYQQAFFVHGYLSRYSSANNHLIGELTGLLVATTVFNLGVRGERWNAEAREGLEREARMQVYEDGVNKEQSFYYHLWVLEYLLLAWLVSIRGTRQLSEDYRGCILAMATFLRDVSAPGGVPPNIGDADDGFVARFDATWPRNPYEDVLSAVGVVFERANFFCDPIPQKAFWYGMLAGKLVADRNSAQPERERIPSPRVYEQGGYAILHAGPTHIVFDAGALGYPSIAAHGHADALSFCVAVRDRWWLVDPGTYSYHDEARWRNYFRGTVAHNTLTVDGMDQSVAGGPFLWLRHAHARMDEANPGTEGCQWVRGSHDGYERIGVKHVREIQLSACGDKIYVFDKVIGSGTHELLLHFHFAPDIVLGFDDTRDLWIATRHGRTEVMEITVPKGWEWDRVVGSEDPILGWFSESLGSKRPAPTLRGHLQGQLPLEVGTVVCIRA